MSVEKFVEVIAVNEHREEAAEKCADELLTLPFLLEQVPVAMNNAHP